MAYTHYGIYSLFYFEIDFHLSVVAQVSLKKKKKSQNCLNAPLKNSVSHVGFVGKLVYTEQCVYCKDSLCKCCNTYWIKGTVMYSLYEELLEEIQFYKISLLWLWMIKICLEAACVRMYSDLVAYRFLRVQKEILYRPTTWCSNKDQFLF